MKFKIHQEIRKRAKNKVTQALAFAAGWQGLMQGVAGVTSLFLSIFKICGQSQIVGSYISALFLNNGCITFVFSVLFIKEFRHNLLALMKRINGTFRQANGVVTPVQKGQVAQIPMIVMRN